MGTGRAEDWRLYWGPGPLPEGAEVLGIRTDARGTGVLLRMPTGRDVIGNAGTLRSTVRAPGELARGRSVAATDRDWDRLLQVGGGNRSAGLRLLLDLWDETHGGSAQGGSAEKTENKAEKG